MLDDFHQKDMLPKSNPKEIQFNIQRIQISDNVKIGNIRQGEILWRNADNMIRVRLFEVLERGGPSCL